MRSCIRDENEKAVHTVPGHRVDSLKKRIKRRHYYKESVGLFKTESQGGLLEKSGAKARACSSQCLSVQYILLICESVVLSFGFFRALVTLPACSHMPCNIVVSKVYMRLSVPVVLGHKKNGKMPFRSVKQDPLH